MPYMDSCIRRLSYNPQLKTFTLKKQKMFQTHLRDNWDFICWDFIEKLTEETLKKREKNQ